MDAIRAVLLERFCISKYSKISVRRKIISEQQYCMIKMTYTIVANTKEFHVKNAFAGQHFNWLDGISGFIASTHKT